MHIVIAGIVDLENADRDQVILEARPLIEEARGEPGCLAYDWTADPYIPKRIHVFEEWTGEAELAVHLKAPSYVNMLAHLGAAGIKEAKTQKYQINKFEPVYDDTGVPRANFFS